MRVSSLLSNRDGGVSRGGVDCGLEVKRAVRPMLTRLFYGGVSRLKTIEGVNVPASAGRFSRYESVGRRSFVLHVVAIL
jgi:hypothetical protein